jgi:hypothetical protein
MLRSLIERTTFQPDDIDALEGAFRCALEKLRIEDSHSPQAEIVAKMVIDAASRGMRDPILMCRQIVSDLGRKEN